MIRSKRYLGTAPADLTSTTSFKVRFSEVDAMKIVWHGEYVRYFEDGREAFGEKYPGIGYPDILASGYTAPIVELNLQYLHSLTIGETATVTTNYIATKAAKIYFEYEIRNAEGELVARGSSTQAFLDGQGNLCLQEPEFYANWKRKWLKKQDTSTPVRTA